VTSTDDEVDVYYVRLMEKRTRCANNACRAILGHVYVSQTMANLGDWEDYTLHDGSPFHRAMVELFKQEKELGAAPFVLVTDHAADLDGETWALSRTRAETVIPLPARVKCVHCHHATLIPIEGRRALDGLPPRR
jgi:hypothetical protein